MTDPVPAQKAPYPVTVETGRNYVWCACGRSQKQPFCDGSHAETGITPVIYKAEETKEVYFCGCKASGNKPLCDGSHKQL